MKIGVLITARLKSSRLPLKLIMDLNGKSVVEHVINRAKQIKNIDKAVLCTSTNSQDSILTDICLDNNIHYFLGSEEDVLGRMYNAARFYGLDYIVSITGENPLFSIENANLVVNEFKNNLNTDFIYTEGLPIGCSVYGLNVKALELICEIKEEVDTEIWGYLINRPEVFNVKCIDQTLKNIESNFRLTIDYQEDFILMNEIFKNFSSNYIPNIYDVDSLFEKNPNLKFINSDKVQATVDDLVIKRINDFYRKNHDQIIKRKEKIYKNQI
ncbi:cytidylyltransferase domain-containing protein [Mangrovivirga cuniculi]|uniref:3-deoxy-manno-octulosonate cytidylyltransferase n=1 Tax=Mangrovivirga cuniculi TaxID=2715131 RepID=A0A4D7JTB4_9BACT|nr:3-deoxy-manno-octulosonate cytidylyltransferase [Mangrovivirga cuniculi]QCK15922.1 3-deoxy-manno-octulosonate cytidylyltransferase [Mangrovivirga cuniculi]